MTAAADAACPLRVAFVVIGRNEEKSLHRCLEGVRRQGGAGRQRTIYVDSASTDRSCAIARSFDGVEVVTLDDPAPNAAKARNAGWRRCGEDIDLVHFVDGDAELVAGWLDAALPAFADPAVGAVFGGYRERHPEASLYNRFADLDWPTGHGPVETFGGIVLVRRSCLVATGGFDEHLRSGEDPALALAIRRLGHCILQLPQAMALHDIDLHRFRDYWRRNVQCGWSMAEVAHRSRDGHPVRAWVGRSRSLPVMLAGALGVVLLALAVSPWVFAGAVVLAALDLLRIARNNLQRAGSWWHAVAYALHARTMMLPLAVGHWRWLRERRAGDQISRRRNDGRP